MDTWREKEKEKEKEKETGALAYLHLRTPQSRCIPEPYLTCSTLLNVIIIMSSTTDDLYSNNWRFVYTAIIVTSEEKNNTHTHTHTQSYTKKPG